MGLNTLKILSFNVWFREDLELHKRMKALGDLIQVHSPDIICFQVFSYCLSLKQLEKEKRIQGVKKKKFVILCSPKLSSDSHFALQEVTPNIYDIFQQSSWWKIYNCSVSSQMALLRPYFCMQVVYIKVYVTSFSNLGGKCINDRCMQRKNGSPLVLLAYFCIFGSV